MEESNSFRVYSWSKLVKGPFELLQTKCSLPLGFSNQTSANYARLWTKVEYL